MASAENHSEDTGANDDLTDRNFIYGARGATPYLPNHNTGVQPTPTLQEARYK